MTDIARKMKEVVAFFQMYGAGSAAEALEYVLPWKKD